MSDSRVPWKPYNWLIKASVYNKRGEIVPWEWIQENVDVIALLFTAKEVDRERVIEKFYGIYENIKYLNLPIEVIYVPMDDTEDDMKLSYEEQANWFTLKFDDPLVPTLKYMYGVTCIPHIVVIKSDGSIISSHGIMDLETYEKNAVITWMSTSASTKNHRSMSKDAMMYGEKWRFLTSEQPSKQDYQRRFNTVVNQSAEKL